MPPTAPLLIIALLLAGAAVGAAGEAAPAPTPAPTPAKVSDKVTDKVTDKEIAALTWEDAANDNDFVSPFARNFDSLKDSDERRKDWDAFTDKLDMWGPGKVPDPAERVRNLLSVPALMDVGEGQFESETPLLIYQRLSHEYAKEQLITLLADIVFHPDNGSVVTTAPELDLSVGVGEERVRERVQIYAKKMLGRVLGKLPIEQQ